ATMRMQVEDHSEILRFLITDLGKDDLILGLPWLRKHNPSVDWEQGEILLDTREVQQEDTDEEYPPFPKKETPPTNCGDGGKRKKKKKNSKRALPFPFASPNTKPFAKAPT